MIDPEIRKQGIGGSEAASALGLSPYGTPLTVVLEKKGLWPRPASTPWQDWGALMEPVILQDYAIQTGRTLVTDHRTIKHPDYPLVATFDATVEGEPRGVDAKCSGWGDDWSQGVPVHYQIQAQVYMMISGFPCWDFAVSIRGARPEIFTEYADEKVQVGIGRRITNLWNRFIIGDEELPLDGSLVTAQYLQARYPREREKLREATAEEIEILRDYEWLRIQQDELTYDRRRLENCLKSAIQTHEGIAWPDGKFTWKRTKDGAVCDWKSMAIALRQKYIEDQKERDALEEFYTRPKPGTRRIYFNSTAYKDAKEQLKAQGGGEEGEEDAAA